MAGLWLAKIVDGLNHLDQRDQLKLVGSLKRTVGPCCSARNNSVSKANFKVQNGRLALTRSQISDPTYTTRAVNTGSFIRRSHRVQGYLCKSGLSLYVSV